MNFLDEKAHGPVVQELVTAVHKSLVPVGFKEIAYGEWERDVGWRLDQIDLRVAAIWRRRLQPAFRVVIPRMAKSALGDTHEYIAEEKLPRILDRTAEVGSHITIPFFRFQIPRFVKNFAGDMCSALFWFDQFATPELCLKKLPQLMKPGCAAFIDAEHYLSSLIQGPR